MSSYSNLHAVINSPRATGGLFTWERPNKPKIFLDSLMYVFYEMGILTSWINSNFLKIAWFWRYLVEWQMLEIWGREDLKSHCPLVISPSMTYYGSNQISECLLYSGTIQGNLFFIYIDHQGSKSQKTKTKD